MRFVFVFLALVACALVAAPAQAPACDISVAAVPAFTQVAFATPFVSTFAVQSAVVVQPQAFAFASPVVVQPAFVSSAFVSPFVSSAVVVNSGFHVRSRGFASASVASASVRGGFASAQAVGGGGGFFRGRSVAVARVRPALFGGTVAVSRVRTR